QIFRSLGQFGLPERLTRALPYLAAGRGDIDVAVGGLEHASRNRSRVIVAGLLWHFGLDQEARRLEVEHEDLRLQERGGDVLALLRLLALEQCHQDAERAEQPGAEIGDRNADPHRPLARKPRDRHQAPHALRDLIEARTLRIGTILAETRNAA